MKRSAFGALMTLIVAITIATPVVYAQSTIMTANVPFAFSVGQSQLPAGSYAVREVGDRATLIQSKDGSEHVLGVYAYAGPSKADETKMVFKRIGDHYFLCQIWTSARGQGLQVPPSNLEKELKAASSGIAGGEETVIVALR
jgi:hypothetical protein